jgi:hypothetical protein
MMDFARRLAPPSDANDSRAVPALPSRFEGEISLRSGPVGSAEAYDQRAAGIVASHEERPVAPAAPAATPPRPVAVESVVERSTPAATPPMSPATVSQREDRMTLEGRVMEKPVVQTAHSRADPDFRPHDPPITARRPGAAPVDAPERPITPMHVQARARAAVPLVHATPESTRRPMSDAALATRVAPAAPPRPIVHVTIDRLEVRAKPATPRPAPAIRTHGATPSVSLGDYLRRRTSKPGDAA